MDRNTYTLFDLENGVPTDAYSLEEAVADGFLVPPKAVSVPLKYQRFIDVSMPVSAFTNAHPFFDPTQISSLRWASNSARRKRRSTHRHF